MVIPASRGGTRSGLFACGKIKHGWWWQEPSRSDGPDLRQRRCDDAERSLCGLPVDPDRRDTGESREPLHRERSTTDATAAAGEHIEFQQEEGVALYALARNGRCLSRS